jgi:hypothetical protein
MEVALRQAFLAVLLFGGSNGALPSSTLADEVPGIGDWAEYHFSLDESPMVVRFVDDSGRTDYPSLTIPRSYVYYAAGAAAGPLPDAIETRTLRIAFADPDHQAWSVTVDEYRERAGPGSSPADLRERLYTMELVASPSTPVTAPVARPPEEYFEGRSDGMDEFRVSAGHSVFIPETPDGFISAECDNPSRPEYFCEYTVRLTPEITARVKFSDFLHGGRSYADQRTRTARAVVCRFLSDC